LSSSGGSGGDYRKKDGRREGGEINPVRINLFFRAESRGKYREFAWEILNIAQAEFICREA
jgi:hypothetical protein